MDDALRAAEATVTDVLSLRAELEQLRAAEADAEARVVQLREARNARWIIGRRTLGVSSATLAEWSGVKPATVRLYAPQEEP